jgi:hypothetical protein
LLVSTVARPLAELIADLRASQPQAAVPQAQLRQLREDLNVAKAEMAAAQVRARCSNRGV